MKFKVHLAGFNVLLSAEQLESIVELLSDSEHIKEEWVGTGKGENGGNYIYRLVKCDTSTVSLNILRDDEIEARRLTTKLWDEAQVTSK